jgi:hypothetical protein
MRGYSHEDADGISWDMEAIAVDFIALAKAGGMEEEEFLRNLHRTWPEVTIEVRFVREDLH